MADRAREKALAESLEDAGDAGPPLPPEVGAVNACRDQPEAYETWIHPGDAGAIYIVVITLSGFCSPDGKVPPYEGDRRVYEIDAKTFQVLKKSIEE